MFYEFNSDNSSSVTIYTLSIFSVHLILYRKSVKNHPCKLWGIFWDNEKRRIINLLSNGLVRSIGSNIIRYILSHYYFKEMFLIYLQFFLKCSTMGVSNFFSDLYESNLEDSRIFMVHNALQVNFMQSLANKNIKCGVTNIQ